MKHYIFSLILLFTSGIADAQNSGFLLYDCDAENEQNCNGFQAGSDFSTSEYTSGKQSSHINSKLPYSLTFFDTIDDLLNHKTFYFHFNYNLKSSSIHPDINWVISIEQKGKQFFWKSFSIKEKINRSNEWINVSDSILLPSDLPKGAKIKSYVWNNQTEGDQYLDNFIVRMKLANMENYLPKTSVKKELTPTTANTITTLNLPYYQLNYNTENQHFYISDTSGKALSNAWMFYIETIDENGKTTLQQFDQFKFNNQKLVLNNEFIKATINIYSGESPELKISSTVNFKKKTTLLRVGVEIPFTDSCKEVYTIEHQIDSTPSGNNFWLGKQGGFKNGKNNRSIYSIHNQKISSLQYSSEFSRAFFNLDFYKDHPHFTMPVSNTVDNKELKIDLSATQVNPGDSLTGGFKLFIGKDIGPFPRINYIPDGYASAIVFTEHADWSTIATQRAVNFGSSDIIDANNASGGFIKHNIPLTKSVFYNNPYNKQLKEVTNDTLLQRTLCSVQNNPEFHSFLKQVHSRGHEIILHTPEDGNSNRKNIERSLDAMQSMFSSTGWIDHGYNNEAESNREDIVADGLIKGKKQYAADLFEKHQLQHFWHAYYEDFPIKNELQFNEELCSPYPWINHAEPRAQFWSHPNHPQSFRYYATYQLTEAPNPELWDYYFSKEKLEKFSDDRSLKILHVYPAAIHRNYGFWKKEESILVIDPYFENCLIRMETMQKENKILFTTVEYYLNYLKKIEQLTWEMDKNGTLMLINQGNQTVTNLTIYNSFNQLKKSPRIDSGSFISWIIN